MNYNLLQEKWIPVLSEKWEYQITWALLRLSRKQTGFVKYRPTIPWTAWQSCVSFSRFFIGAKGIPRTARH